MAFLLTSIAAVAVGQSSLHAEVILSNLPGTSSGGGSSLGLGIDLLDRTQGVGLTTGATPLDFASLEALIFNTGFAAPPPVADLSGGIYRSVGGNPGVLLAPFDPVSVTSEFGPAEVSITTASPFTLAANTSYWFVLDGPGTENSLLWNSLAPNVGPTATGVTFDGYRFSSNGGGAWASSSVFNGVRISVVPEPAGLMLFGMGILLVAIRSRRTS